MPERKLNWRPISDPPKDQFDVVIRDQAGVELYAWRSPHSGQWYFYPPEVVSLGQLKWSSSWRPAASTEVEKLVEWRHLNKAGRKA